MKRLAGRLEQFVARKESTPSTAIHIIVALLFISLARVGLERVPGDLMGQEFLHLDVIGIIIFYAATFFLFYWLFAFFFPEEGLRVRSIVLVGMFGGLLPPLITYFFPPSDAHYSYFSEFTWNFFDPSQPVGESIGIWLMIGVVCVYFWYKKKNFLYLPVGFLGAYALLQLSIWFITVPAFALTSALDVARPDLSNFTGFSLNAVLLITALVAFISLRYRFFVATLKRFQHTLIRCVLVLFGAQVAGIVNLLSLVEGFAFMLAFMLIQAENDYYDKELDAATSRASLITYEDLIFVRFFMVLLVSVFMFIQPAVSMSLALFFLLGFIYNHPAFRFKKHFVTASFVEGGLAFLAMLAGVFSAGNSLDSTDIFWIAGVALIFAVLANIRDYKDFVGDKKIGIKTLYVTLQESAITPKKTHIILIEFSILVHIVVIAVSLYLHLALPLLVIGFLLLIASPFPLLLLNHPKKSASSIATVTQAGLLLLFVAFGVLPTFSYQHPHHLNIQGGQPQELLPPIIDKN